MSTIVVDCPRCNAQHTTADVLAQAYRSTEYDWKRWFEVFCLCRNCSKSSTFLVGLKEYSAQGAFYGDNGLVKFSGSLNQYFDVKGYISLKDAAARAAPEFLPPAIKAVFDEGAICFAVGCFNAAGTMFRLAIDLSTRAMLPAEGQPQRPNAKVCRDLGLRLPWLFDTDRLPEALRDLAGAVKEDGNDGAHAGNLSQQDAEDLLDFSSMLLERLYTEPERLRQAAERRAQRRQAIQ